MTGQFVDGLSKWLEFPDEPRTIDRCEACGGGHEWRKADLIDPPDTIGL